MLYISTRVWMLLTPYVARILLFNVFHDYINIFHQYIKTCFRFFTGHGDQVVKVTMFQIQVETAA